MSADYRDRHRWEPQITLRHRPGGVFDPVRRVWWQNNGRSSRTRSFKIVNDRVQPIRSAITVAGI
jgi:hypothetical protein